MQIKDVASVLAVIVSVGSAIVAYDARERAEQAAQERFRSEKTVELLSLIHRELSQAGEDKAKMARSCVFAGSLGRAELEIRKGAEGLVAPFLIGLSRSGALPPYCDLTWEDFMAAYLARENPENAPLIAPQSSPDGYAPAPLEEPIIIGPGEPSDAPVAPAKPHEIGKWHAIIASYRPNAAGCDRAWEDVTDFSERIAPLITEPRLVAVYRTRLSDHYVVTIDAGDSREDAERLARAARSVANEDGAGADAFAQGNRGWRVDPANCESFAWAHPVEVVAN